MLEQYCCEDLRNMCRYIVEGYDPPKVKLKTDKTEYPENPYKDFMREYKNMYFRSIFDWGIGKRCRIHDLCRKWFYEKSLILVVVFIYEIYNGDIEKAMEHTEHFENLWNQFQEWFDQKRRDFRMTFDITDSKKQILENGKKPNSHGGVANLLKILTKTMEKQGSSVENIAKVQYTICMQAGIYIPDEFIEDVAIALYIKKEER